MAVESGEAATRSGAVEAGRSSAFNTHESPADMVALAAASATIRGESAHRLQPPPTSRSGFCALPWEPAIEQAVKQGAPFKQRQDAPEAVAINTSATVRSQANLRLCGVIRIPDSVTRLASAAFRAHGVKLV